MAELAPYTVVPGTLAGMPQPAFPLDGGAELRPWADADAPALRAAYADPDIQRWHVRMIDPASCRVAEKAGFAPEGVRYRSARHADGHHDMHVHARLADAVRPD